MKFNIKEFRKQQYEERSKTIILENFGDAKEPIEWVIRGLTAEDIVKVHEASEANKKAMKAVQAAANSIGNHEIYGNAIAELLGVSGNISDALVRQMVIFQLGSVDPKIESRADAVKFARVHPIEFNFISKEIWDLTGMGQQKKKPT